jgi:DNA polymerase-3 subunit delta'
MGIDSVDGLPHPRETLAFYGNEAAEYALYNALQSSKMHHAWIFTGPKGVGKATLAYRFARRYLGAKPTDESPLSSYEHDPIVSKIANGSLGDLKTATRYDPEAETVKRDVSVSAIRQLTNMFSLKSSNDFGRRVAIIDSVDDLRDAGANALLKTLEEPPKGAVIILIANSLGTILPTIRSRCRLLSLKPMIDGEMKAYLPKYNFAQLAMANGCYGRALALDKYDVDGIYNLISGYLNTFPNCPMEKAFTLADMARDEDVFDIIFELLSNWIYRATNAGTGGDIKEIEVGESAALARLTSRIPKEKLFKAWKSIQDLRGAVANNLDRGAAILESLKIIKKSLENK